MSPSDAWLEVTVLSSTATHRQFCDFLFDWVEDQFEVEDAKALNEFLALADPTSLPVERCATILRATSRARHMLPNWTVFQEATVAKFGHLPEFNPLFRGIK